jgi:TRAP-type C4-dicarboxylate transport system permease small subunit
VQQTKKAVSMFWKTIDWILEKLKIIGAICLAEIVAFMATLSVAMALPYTHKIKGHVGVEILVRLLSVRTQAIIDICTGILSFALFGIVTWRMTEYAHTMQKSGEVSMNLELPEHVIIYITAFCLFIFILIILQDISNNIKKLKEK